MIVGGVHGCQGGPCMVGEGMYGCRGHVWLGGACVVVGESMHCCEGCVRGCGGRGACVVVGGHAWHMTRYG